MHYAHADLISLKRCGPNPHMRMALHSSDRLTMIVVMCCPSCPISYASACHVNEACSASSFLQEKVHGSDAFALGLCRRAGCGITPRVGQAESAPDCFYKLTHLWLLLQDEVASCLARHSHRLSLCQRQAEGHVRWLPVVCGNRCVRRGVRTSWTDET